MTITDGRLAVCLVAAALCLRAADCWYYRDATPALRALGLAERDGNRVGTRRRLDPVFAPVPFAWAWCELLAATCAARLLNQWVGYLALTLFAATRFRFLQEVSHTALHRGLCRSRRWQQLLSLVFVDGPLFRPDAERRFVNHIRLHHAHVNEPETDPNIARFVQAGFLPGLFPARRFWTLLVRPLTPAGLYESLRVAVANARANGSGWTACARAITVALAVLAFWATGGWPGLIAGYAVPLLTVYPLFSWVSLLAEHRWFVECDETDRRLRECTLGRPTDYRGVCGWVVSRAIFPASDRYHLAHSLYPSLRWTHLPAVDAVLRDRDPAYSRFTSRGLIFSSSPYPSALSELRERVTGRRRDLATWAQLPAAQPYTGMIPTVRGPSEEAFHVAHR